MLRRKRHEKQRRAARTAQSHGRRPISRQSSSGLDGYTTLDVGRSPAVLDRFTRLDRFLEAA